jgi:PAS domain-containing protein
LSQNDATYYRAILDAIPLPVFIVDGDVRIRDLNATASRTFGARKPDVYFVRGGDALHCLHSSDVPEGCGRGPNCKNCVIRRSVGRAIGGETVYRTRMKFKFAKDLPDEHVEFMITASPIPQSPGLVLIVLENITEVSTLKDIIPICMHCRKVRDDRQYWEQVEGYLLKHAGLLFSHGLCPPCAEKASSECSGPDEWV